MGVHILNKTLGKCDCGAIEFEFSGEPINTAFCYCRSCQIHTGSDKWFGVWVPKDNFHFTKGVPSTYTRLGDSGKKMEHKFCSKCGTTLAVDVEVGGFYSVAAATLSNSNELTPNMLIYTSHAAKWAVLPENVPKFDILPPDLDNDA
jgi:hypothetical protein